MRFGRATRISQVVGIRLAINHRLAGIILLYYLPTVIYIFILCLVLSFARCRLVQVFQPIIAIDRDNITRHDRLSTHDRCITVREYSDLTVIRYNITLLSLKKLIVIARRTNRLAKTIIEAFKAIEFRLFSNRLYALKHII